MSHRFVALLLAAASAPALAASYPPGVTTLRNADVQPAGLAQPLPSTRRYTLIWKDQLPPVNEPLNTSIVQHYVGTQKQTRAEIDAYRAVNPNFLNLTYHLAYGLDATGTTITPITNITQPNRDDGIEEDDTFNPYFQTVMPPLDRTKTYLTSGGVRIDFDDQYHLMDISSMEWRQYMRDTLLYWATFPTTKSTGFLLDAAQFPHGDSYPATWWTALTMSSTQESLRDYWNPRATDYFNYLRAAFTPTTMHPTYLVIANPGPMTDLIDDPKFLAGTDGVFTRDWQLAFATPASFALSASRITRYATSKGKVSIADINLSGVGPGAPTLEARMLYLASYLLLKNGTSYYMLGNSDITWWPEYEIDLGGYDADPPEDFEQLRVAGAGGSAGGLYARKYVSGYVLVNTAATQLTFTLPKGYNGAAFSGGGIVMTDATMAPQTLTYVTPVPAGPITVAPGSAVIVRDPSGAPPPGVEPTTTLPDGGVTSDGGGIPVSGGGGTIVPGQHSNGCNCELGAPGEFTLYGIGMLLVAAALLRRRFRR